MNNQTPIQALASELSVNEYFYELLRIKIANRAHDVLEVYAKKYAFESLFNRNQALMIAICDEIGTGFLNEIKNNGQLHP